MVQIAPELLGLLEDVGVDGFLVDADQLAVLHEELAVGNGGLALAAGHAEDDVAVDVRVGERGVRLVIHDDHVRRCTGLEDTELVGEVLRTDQGVVLKEHVRDLAPADVRQAGVLALRRKRDLDGLDHVVGVSVGAHAEQHARLVKRQHRAGADGVAHIGLGVVDDHGAGVLNEFNFGGIDMDAVAENGLFAQNAVVVQALHGAAAVVLQGVVHVVHALGDMDVITGAAIVGGDHAVKGLVGDGEQGVAAEHCGEHRVLFLLAVGDEVGVFLHGLDGLLLAVAVGNLVAQAGADAEFLGGLGDLKQAAGNLAEGCVMVEDRRHALLDAVEIQRIGGGLCSLERQLAVDGPPRAVEDLKEVRGVVALDGQAAGEGGIDVGVRIDERRHDHAALGINELCIGVFRLQIGGLADLLDLGAVDDHAAVGQIGRRLAAGDELAVCENVHDVDLLRINKKWGRRTPVPHLHSRIPE